MNKSRPTALSNGCSCWTSLLKISLQPSPRVPQPPRPALVGQVSPGRDRDSVQQTEIHKLQLRYT